VLGALEPLAVKVSAVLEKTANAVGATVSSIADDYVKWIESLDAEEVGRNIEGSFRDAAMWAASWYDTISNGINKVIQFFKEPPEWVSTVQLAAKGSTGIAQGAASLATRLAAAGSKIGQGVTGAAANVGVPGAREAYGFYKESAKSFWEAAESMSAAADENLLGIKNENKKASKNAADVAKKQITAVERLQRLFDEKDKQRAAQQARQQDKKPEVKAIQDMANEVSSAVKKSVSQPASLDARSRAGSNFLLNAMTGPRQTLEKQQLDVQKKIEKNTKIPMQVMVQGIG
jgi:hypothetical protein